MTDVKITVSDDIRCLEAHNHASSEALCSAVSMMCYTLAGYLHNVPCRFETEKLDPGDVKIEVMSRHCSVRNAFDMAEVGFMQLEKSYPGEIKVTICEKN